MTTFYSRARHDLVEIFSTKCISKAGDLGNVSRHSTSYSFDTNIFDRTDVIIANHLKLLLFEFCGLVYSKGSSRRFIPLCTRASKVQEFLF
ncbi:hypothetical protein TU84_07845 [Pseudomonas helleri]|nr:hypothetical protein TU84_07845 [Pseudomonas helleri]